MAEKYTWVKIKSALLKKRTKSTCSFKEKKIACVILGSE